METIKYSKDPHDICIVSEFLNPDVLFEMGNDVLKISLLGIEEILSSLKEEEPEFYEDYLKQKEIKKISLPDKNNFNVVDKIDDDPKIVMKIENNKIVEVSLRGLEILNKLIYMD